MSHSSLSIFGLVSFEYLACHNVLASHLYIFEAVKPILKFCDLISAVIIYILASYCTTLVFEKLLIFQALANMDVFVYVMIWLFSC